MQSVDAAYRCAVTVNLPAGKRYHYRIRWRNRAELRLFIFFGVTSAVPKILEYLWAVQRSEIFE